MVLQNSLLDFNGIMLNVERIDEENFFINVSGVTRKFNKQFVRWEEQESTKEYINTLIGTKAVSFNTSELIKKVKEKGKQKQTYIHSSLLVHFGRFISPKFAVWADKLVYNYITGNLKDEIKKLQNEKKLAKIDADGYVSVRGIAQRTGYTEAQIRSFVTKEGILKQTKRSTQYWKILNDMDGLTRTKGKYGTPYFEMDRIVDLLDYKKTNKKSE